MAFFSQPKQNNAIFNYFQCLKGNQTETFFLSSIFYGTKSN